MILSKGKLFIISAPSGAGKTTLAKAVLNQFPDLLFSVSYTTRAPRVGEQNGVDYFFINKKKFIIDIEKDKWAEWAEVYGNFYGTSAEFLNKNLNNGKHIFLDIDINGTLQILKHYPDAITIFIMPPSLDILKTRLKSRNTDSEDEIEKRLLKAENEINKKNLYQYIIINDNLQTAINKLISLIKHEIKSVIPH